MSQKQKILTMLIEAGNKGINSFELYKEYMPRFAARILDLRKEGYVIESKRNGNSVDYILKTEQIKLI